MVDPALRAFHEQLLKKYVECWHDPEARGEQAVSEDEAAYNLLEHAGKLWRYTSEDRFTRGLQSLEPEERRRLGLAATRYIAAIDLADHARDLLTNEALEPEQIGAIESLIIRRDALETVLSAAVTTCTDLIGTDAEVRRALAEAKCHAAEIDDVLLLRPDVVAVAAPTMDGLRRQVCEGTIDWRSHWWFDAEDRLAVDVEQEWEDLIAPHTGRVPFPILCKLDAARQSTRRAAAGGPSSEEKSLWVDLALLELEVEGEAEVGVRIEPESFDDPRRLYLVLSGEHQERFDRATVMIPGREGPFSVELSGGRGLFPLELGDVTGLTREVEISLFKPGDPSPHRVIF